MNIGSVISKAIKEGKWINVHYKNTEEQTTVFWMAIYDIHFFEKKLTVRMFNDNKSYDTVKADIYFFKIQSAEIIELSHYDVPESLIEKIESNLDKCKWLDYDRFNNNILNYYNECSYLDSDPFQKEYEMIPGIDLNVLRKNKEHNLNEEQLKLLLNKIYKYDIKNNNNSKYDLCISVLSIDQGNKKYLVCYYEVFFDPYKKTLSVNKDLKFNKSLLIEGRRHSLFNYVNSDVEEFIKGFKENYWERIEILKNNLRDGEVINTRPDMFFLEREYIVDLSYTFDIIQGKYLNGDLSTPLKSFFGNISRRNYKGRKDPTIVIYDDRVNINQVNVIYNALKYPVTYVQGPPGTGKTQTILNVILSSFFGGKSVLVCSSNNKPVDGIIDKLVFKYKEEEVLFPFLRLGKISDVIDATEKIKRFYEFETKKIVKEHLINKIKTNVEADHTELLNLLSIQEKRIEIENYLECSNKLLDSLDDKNNRIGENLKKRIDELQSELKELPNISNEDLLKLFKPVKDDFSQLQFLYFKSLEYIKKLKLPRYSALIEICYINDEAERAMEFNKWLQSDNNMKLLNNVFPIIFSTNISSNRLGSPNYKFNLVIMDEAGQCNVAHSLIPISRAESLLLVGDPNQLKPVIILEDSVNKKLKENYNVSNDYDYISNSILDVMIKHDNISKYILLKYHYRCGKKIIKFSNDRYYDSSLDLSYLQDSGDIEFLDIKNKNIIDKNAAYDEAKGIIDYIKRNKLENVSIVTPFVNQQNLIKKLLKEENIENVNCGTIHSLQGAEKDNIILSTAISSKTSQKTYEWIKNNFEIINVGVTRAKNKLIISGDMDAINALSNKDDDLYNLIKYASSDGKVIVPPNESVKIEIGMSNGSKNEEEFFKTISQFCSVHSTYEVKRNVMFKDIFKDDPILSKESREFDMVIYKRNWKKLYPKIVIELNGGEHFGTHSREKSDKRKKEICERKNIKFIMIDNSFIKSYEFIKVLLIGARSKKASEKSLFDYDSE